MRKVRFGECDSTEEVTQLFNDIFANQALIEAKVEQNAGAIEALQPKKKKKKKDEGSVLNKLIVSTMIIVLLFVINVIANAGYVATDINYDIASNPDLLSQYLRDSVGSGTYHLNDDIGLLLGTGAANNGDFQISSSSANLLTIGQIVAGTGSVAVGVDDAGLDWTFYGDTTGNYIKWDTSEDTLTGNLGNVLFTTVDAEADQFKVDATGTVAGDAINLETTDGGILLNADGASNGDIELNAADDITLTAAGLVNVSGSLVNAAIQDIPAGGTSTAAVLTNIVITVGADAGGDIVTIANGTPGQILYLICEDATGTTTITPTPFNGGTSITFDALGDTVTLIYTSGTGWSIVGGNSYTII